MERGHPHVLLLQVVLGPLPHTPRQRPLLLAAVEPQVPAAAAALVLGGAAAARRGRGGHGVEVFLWLFCLRMVEYVGEFGVRVCWLIDPIIYA